VGQRSLSVRFMPGGDAAQEALALVDIGRSTVPLDGSLRRRTGRASASRQVLLLKHI